MEWYKFDDGNSIGKRGSESGVIIDDVENFREARETIEKDGGIAPFSVTMGIYGLMFHTCFSESHEEANRQAELLKTIIEDVLNLMEVDENHS